MRRRAPGPASRNVEAASLGEWQSSGRLIGKLRHRAAEVVSSTCSGRNTPKPTRLTIAAATCV